MAKIELEGMQELIDKVNKLGSQGTQIKKNALEKSAAMVKGSMEEKAPRSKANKRHMADNIQVSEVKTVNGVDFIQIGPNKGNDGEFFHSKFTEWGTSKIPAQHWAENSVLENKKKIDETIKDELQRGLDGLD